MIMIFKNTLGIVIFIFTIILLTRLNTYLWEKFGIFKLLNKLWNRIFCTEADKHH